MGEIADMMLEGTLCAGCGVYIDRTSDDFGFPRYCSPECTPEDDEPVTYRAKKKGKSAASRRGQKWRRANRSPLLDAALAYGREESEENAKRLLGAAKTYTAGPQSQEARESR